MGRELRRVPANWEHPKDSSGHYVPLFGGSFSKRAAEWDEASAQWSKGLRSDWEGGWRPIEPKYLDGRPYSDWDGERPKQDDYMPDWPESERTHYQMYETCTEGTPISPVMDSPESLARWLADNGASAFADMTATYEQWLATIQSGWSAPSAIIGGGKIISGVEASV